MIWIEVLDRRGHVVQRTRHDAYPVVIGRAYGGDVVLDDRHVEAVHARLVREADGAVVLEDAGSVNGVVVGGARAARVPIDGPTLVHLGQTALRFVPAGTSVPAALPVPAAHRGVMALVASPRRAALIAVAGALLSALSLWLGDPGEKALRQALGGGLGVAAALALWAGGWALAARLHGHRPAFLAHFAAAWLAVVVLDLAGVLADTAAFMLDLDALAVAAGAAAAALVLTALLAVHLALASTLAPRRRVAVAAATVAAFAGLFLVVGEAAKSDFDGERVTIRAGIAPVPAALVRSREVGRFLGETASLVRAVDRLADEE